MVLIILRLQKYKEFCYKPNFQAYFFKKNVFLFTFTAFPTYFKHFSEDSR
jgi:hypothetical protein